jgi:hypothetical protein
MPRRARGPGARMPEPTTKQLHDRIQFLEGVVIETQIAREQAERKLEAIQNLLVTQEPPQKRSPLEYREALKRAVKSAG